MGNEANLYIYKVTGPQHDPHDGRVLGFEVQSKRYFFGFLVLVLFLNEVNLNRLYKHVQRQYCF